VAGLFQDGFEAELVGEREGRQFDHDPRRLLRTGDSLCHLLNRGWCWQAGHDGGRVARDLGYVIGNDDISRRKLGPFGGVGIETDHPPSALDKVAGDRAAHDAKPDNANGLVHASSLPPVEFD